MPEPNVLVVSPSQALRQSFDEPLRVCGLETLGVLTSDQAERALNDHAIRLVFCSDELPGSVIDGLIRQCSRHSNRIPLIVVSRLDDWDRFLDFLQRGAFDYVLYPPNGIEMDRVVKNALSLVQQRSARAAAT